MNAQAIPVVTDAAYAGASNRLFVAPEQLFDGEGTMSSQPSVVTVHDGDTAIMRARIDLQSVPGISGRVRPSRVFVGPTPDRLYVLAAPDVAQSRPVVLTVDVSGL